MSPLKEIYDSTPDEIIDINWKSTQRERGQYNHRLPKEREFGSDVLSRLNASETGTVTLVFTKEEQEEPHMLDFLYYSNYPRIHSQNSGAYIKNLFRSLKHPEIQYRTKPVDKKNPHEDWKLIIAFREEK